MQSNTGHRPKRQGERHNTQLERKIVERANVNKRDTITDMISCYFCGIKLKDNHTIKHELKCHKPIIKELLELVRSDGIENANLKTYSLFSIRKLVYQKHRKIFG